MSVEDVSAIIEEALVEVPYNNFTKISLASGLPVPEELGGNCVEMVRRWTRRLAMVEGELAHLAAHVLEKDEDGEDDYYELYHHAIVKRIGDEWYFIDPVILLKEPIPIEKILSAQQEYGESGYVFDAYPVVNGNATHVIVKPTGDHTFSVRMEVPKPQGYKFIFEHHYFLNEPVELPSSYDDEIARIDESVFLVRFFTEEMTRVTVSFDSDIDRTMLFETGNTSEWATWDFSKDPDLFMVELSRCLPLSIKDQIELLRSLWEVPDLHAQLRAKHATYDS